MPRRYTLAEIAARFAELDHLPKDQEKRLLRRLQNLNAKGMLRASGVRDQRNTVEFDLLEVYRARIFDVVYRTGSDVASIYDELDSAMSRMSLLPLEAPSQQIDGGAVSKGPLRDAIKGVAQGERWFLSLTVRTRNPIFEGLSAHIHHEGDRVAKNDLEERSPSMGNLLFHASIPLHIAFEGLPELSNA